MALVVVAPNFVQFLTILCSFYTPPRAFYSRLLGLDSSPRVTEPAERVLIGRVAAMKHADSCHGEQSQH